MKKEKNKRKRKLHNSNRFYNYKNLKIVVFTQMEKKIIFKI